MSERLILPLQPLEFDTTAAWAEKLEKDLVEHCRKRLETCLENKRFILTGETLTFMEAEAYEEGQTVPEIRQKREELMDHILDLSGSIREENFQTPTVNFLFPTSFFCTSSAMGDRAVCNLVFRRANLANGEVSPLCMVDLTWAYGDYGHGSTTVTWHDNKKACVTYRVPVFHNGKMCSRYEFSCTAHYKNGDRNKSILMGARRLPYKVETQFETRLTQGTVDIRDTIHFQAITDVGRTVDFSSAVQGYEEEIDNSYKLAQAIERSTQDNLCGSHDEMDKNMELKKWPEFLGGIINDYDFCTEIRRKKGGNRVTVNMDYPRSKKAVITIRPADRLAFSNSEAPFTKSFEFPSMLTAETARELIQTEFANFIATTTRPKS